MIRHSTLEDRQPERAGGHLGPILGMRDPHPGIGITGERDGPTLLLLQDFVQSTGSAKFGKAVAKITDDLDQVLAFYDYPAEHWVHLRTTNPIESTFATVRHRTKITKGPGSKAAGLAMAFKLIEAAQARWRAANAPNLVALARAGATFTKGRLVERTTTGHLTKVA